MMAYTCSPNLGRLKQKGYHKCKYIHLCLDYIIRLSQEKEKERKAL